MAKAIEISNVVGISGQELSTVTDNELSFSVDDLTLLHVRSDDGIMFPITVNVYRKVPLVKGCSVDTICSFYGSTCDTIFLPPGEYEYEFCDEGSAKYTPDGIFDISLILEPVSSQFALAQQLNANNC